MFVCGQENGENMYPTFSEVLHIQNGAVCSVSGTAGMRATFCGTRGRETPFAVGRQVAAA